MKARNLRTPAFVIAQARIVLCIAILLSIYVDPSTGGFLGIGRYMLITLAVHLIYGASTLIGARGGRTSESVLRATAAIDIVFATVLAFFTEGPTSPAFAMFLFAIVATGYWAEFRLRVVVTLLSVVLYLFAIVYPGFVVTRLLLMRAVYLGIAGYLIDFFGRERDRYEARFRELEAESERQSIARSLHDGFMQALAAVSVRLETCRDMIACAQNTEALTEIGELQAGVAVEYDEVRRYVLSLAKADQTNIPMNASACNTEFRFQASFVARGSLVEHVVQIVLEGVRNTLQHANAKSAEIDVSAAGSAIRIAIDDDGVGFGDFSSPPWTIASRVAEFGGRLAIRPTGSSGAHLEIELPNAST